MEGLYLIVTSLHHHHSLAHLILDSPKAWGPIDFLGVEKQGGFLAAQVESYFEGFGTGSVVGVFVTDRVVDVIRDPGPGSVLHGGKICGRSGKVTVAGERLRRHKTNG